MVVKNDSYFSEACFKLCLLKILALFLSLKYAVKILQVSLDTLCILCLLLIMIKEIVTEKLLQLIA